MMYTYCLFCETAKCSIIAMEAKAFYQCTAISPKQIQHTWQKGAMVDRIRDFLPGYLFLYSEEPLNLYRCRYLPGVLRCLRTYDNSYELGGSDDAFAKMLLEKEGIIGKTEVYQEGDRIHLTEGAFSGLKAKILKVDHRAGRMQIEIPFARRLVKTWVEYEIVDPAAAKFSDAQTGNESDKKQTAINRKQNESPKKNHE